MSIKNKKRSRDSKQNIEPYIVRYIRINHIKQQFDNDDVNFLNWMTQIENIVYFKLGLSLDDLPDEMYRIQFDNETTAEYMANTVIDNHNKSMSLILLNTDGY